VSARAVKRTIEANHAAGSSFGDGEIVLARDGVQSLRERSSLRWIGQRDVDIVSCESARAAMFCGLQLRANGDFRFVTVDFLRGADYFAGDRAQLGFRQVFLATAREKQKNERGARRENPHAPAQIQV
jgi:hypothetical protein